MMVRKSRIVSIHAGAMFLLLAGCVVSPATSDAPVVPEDRVVVKIDNGPYIGVSRESIDALDAFRSGATTSMQHYRLGRPAHDTEITAWDVDIMPDGHGLPLGSGTVAAGAMVYAQQCAACHGKSGEGVSPYLALSARESSDRTVGSYWPYATTVFDYVLQTMPFEAPGSLTNDEAYALTALLLYMNDIIMAADVMDATSLPRVVMPNANGFIPDDRENSNTTH
ncbi:MAG: c-type cytochrome [Woeseiales bacterium]